MKRFETNGHTKYETSPSTILHLTRKKTKLLAKGHVVRVMDNGKTYEIRPDKVPTVLQKFTKSELLAYIKQL